MHQPYKNCEFFEDFNRRYSSNVSTQKQNLFFFKKRSLEVISTNQNKSDSDRNIKPPSPLSSSPTQTVNFNKNNLDYQQTSHEHGIENAQLTQYLYFKHRLTEAALSLIAFQSILIDLIWYELDYQGSRHRFLLIYVLNGLSIILIFFTILRYRQEYQLEKERQLEVNTKAPLIILEPYPQLDQFQQEISDYCQQTSTHFKINWYLGAFLLFRVYMIVRFTLYQMYLNNRMIRLSRMFGSDPGYIYTLKVLFRNHQIYFATIALSTSIFLFMVLIHIFESPTFINNSDDPIDYTHYLNCFWFVIITMTTVGFGDYYPRTYMGRTLNLFISLYGICIVSMTVSIVQNFIMMDQPEKRTITVVKRLHVKNQLKDKAANLLTSTFRNLLFIKNYSKRFRGYGRRHIFLAQLKRRHMTTKKHGYEFRTQNRKFKNMNDTDDTYGDMLGWFDILREEIQLLKHNQTQIEEVVEATLNNSFERVDQIYDETFAELEEMVDQHQLKYGNSIQFIDEVSKESGSSKVTETFIKLSPINIERTQTDIK